MVSKYSKNKRASTTFLEEVAILVLVVILLIPVLGFFSKLFAAQFSEKDDGSKANFDRLYNEIKQLMDDPSPKAYTTFNYFIGNDKILVGFDYNWDGNKQVINHRLWPDANIYKSFSCGNSACICLYNNNWKPKDAAKRDQGKISCGSDIFAGKDVVFFREGSNIAPKTLGLPRDDANGNYLVLYGEDWKLQPLYIEKDYREREGKYYIYISKISEGKSDDPASIRKTAIERSRN